MKLKKGEFETKDLVNLFGTSNLKKRYEKTKKLGGKDKESLLKKASKFCNIEDLGKGKFMIHKVYSMLKDDQILQLKTGIYQYMAPLILSKLINECDQNGKITLSFLGWVRKFDMVNDNYNYMKYHQDTSSEKLEINSDIMWEYFDKIDECMKYYFDKCLNIMQNPNGLDLIDCIETKMVRKVIIDPQSQDGKLNIECSYINEPISDEDNRFVLDCEQQAKIIADIQKPQEKFYGTKSYIYKNYLREKLSERNILFTYKAYNIFFKDYNKNVEALKKFEYKNNCDFVSDFNEYFIKYVNDKAQLRQKQELEKSQNATIDIKFLEEHRLLETYLDEMHKLSEITLRKDSENLIDKLKIVDTVESIANEFNINIIKK